MFSIQQYPCIVWPFVSSSYFWRTGNTPQFFPNIWPKNRRTSLLNSSLIPCILLSPTATKLAAAGCSQTKFWFRMWLMESIMFLCTSFNFVYCRPLLTIWLPFLYCHENFVLLVIEIKMCLWIASGFDAKCQEFQSETFFLVSGGYPKSQYSATFKIL